VCDERARRNVRFRGLSGWAAPVPRHRGSTTAEAGGENRCARDRAASVEFRGSSRPAERRWTMSRRRCLRDSPVSRSLGISCALRGLRPLPVRGPRGHHRSVASRWRTTLRRHSMTVSVSFEASAQLPGPSRSHRSGAEAPSWDTGTLPLLGFVTCSPLHRHAPCASTPGPGPSRDPIPVAPKSRGPTAPPVQPRSVLVVSHHLDGFLRTRSRGLVASRCRSWGSPRFTKPAPVGPTLLTSSLARRGVSHPKVVSGPG
jgi:hypothetical protein